jgi:DNA phosphorothioation-associated putative methyltransferase
VYLALSRFRRRPKLSDLPQPLQLDLKDFFGSYKSACQQGDRALFAIGDRDRVRDAIDAASVGKRMPSALYVHVSAVPRLPVALRVLEGAARELLGVVPDAAIVKIDRDRPRLSYLEYPRFDQDPHPALQGAFTVDLASLRADHLDYSKNNNPPILHRKERFVGADYPLRERFLRLTKQEERAGLFTDPSRIGNRQQWNYLLQCSGVELRGHRLVRRS